MNGNKCVTMKMKIISCTIHRPQCQGCTFASDFEVGTANSATHSPYIRTEAPEAAGLRQGGRREKEGR